MPIANRAGGAPDQFKEILAKAFLHAGWRIRRRPRVGGVHADLIADGRRGPERILSRSRALLKAAVTA